MLVFLIRCTTATYLFVILTLHTGTVNTQNNAKCGQNKDLNEGNFYPLTQVYL